MSEIQHTPEILNHFSKIIFDGAVSVHREMGPGLLESIYQECLVRELQIRGLKVECMVQQQLHYKGIVLSKRFCIDVLVENSIILELKSVEGILTVHEAQLLSYLKLADLRLGFLINFNVGLLKDGFRRFVNKF
ncbi:MAG TPA: GxxExxY protein [Chryseolinea sp.]|nr:GxxExxY protein [Chryseolinea sp.]